MLILAIWSFFMSKKTEGVVFLISILFLIIYTGLRFEVGADWAYYDGIFKQADWSCLWGNRKVEPLFIILCILIKSLGGSFYIVSILISTVTLLLIGKSIKDYSKMPIVSLMLLMLPFFLFGISQIRQGLAIALVIFSYRYIVRNQFLAFISILILAVGFHFSAILFVPVYFFADKRVSLWLSGAIIVICLLLNAFSGTSVFVKLSSCAFDHIHYKYMAYYDPDSPIALALVSLYWRLFIFTLVVCLAYVAEDVGFERYRNVYLIGIVYFILLANTPTISIRGSLYCKIFEIFIISDALYYFYERHKYYWVMILFSISVSYFSRQLYFHTQDDRMVDLVEYKMIFNPSRD